MSKIKLLFFRCNIMHEFSKEQGIEELPQESDIFKQLFSFPSFIYKIENPEIIYLI